MATQDKTEGVPVGAPLSERLVTPIVWLGGAISATLILAALGLTSYSVFMRYVLNAPPTWVDELTGFGLVGLVMFGVAEGYRRGNHITIDLLTSNLSPRMRKLQGVWSDLAVLAIACVLVISTLEAIHFSRDFGAYTSGAIEIGTWIVQLPILIGGALLGLFAVAKLIGRFLPEVQQ